MEQAQKKLLIIVVILIVIVVGVWLSLSNTPSGQSGSGADISANAPSFSDEERLGVAEMSAEKIQTALAYKEELLAKARSGEPFSADEKAAIGKLMLTEAHLYNFSNEEREAVFSALRRQ